MTKRKPPKQYSPNRDKPNKTRQKGSKKSPQGDHAVLFGIHAVSAALSNPQRQVLTLMVTANVARDLEAILPAHSEIKSAADITKFLGDQAVHQGIAGTFSPLPETKLSDLNPQKGPVLMLDQVTDPHNVGAIIRSATVFGAQAIIVTRHNSPSSEGILAKSASGALEITPIITVANLARSIEELKDLGFFVIGLDEGGSEIKTMTQHKPLCLVLGAEGPGLRRLTRENCDAIASLPAAMRSDGKAFATLNVSNAAAVALYAITSDEIPASSPG